MDQRKKKQLKSIFVNITLVFTFFAFILIFSAVKGSATSQGDDLLSAEAEKSLGAETNVSTVFLPMVARKYPKPLSIFGVENNRGTVLKTVDLAADAEVSWTRYNGILWHEVEPDPVDNPDDYDWAKLSQFEAEILALKENGITPMVIIRGTPTWARMDEYPEQVCGPIRQDALDDFADFAADMVQKYSKPPYDIQYWELGNEPDVHPEIFTGEWTDPPYGCWGNKNDNYYGGGWYAGMLRVVYLAIKQVNPQVKVVLGGLLINCDPTVQGKEKECLSSNYLEGILRGGGGDYVDIIAYHAYPYWGDNMVNMDWDLVQINWAHRGGTLLGKLDFLNDVMKRYNVQKPIIMNEGGLMCGYNENDPKYDLCFTDAYEQAKANYVVRMYGRTGAVGLMGSAWYTLHGPGWRNGGLLDGVNKRPAYDTFAFLAGKLGDAVYLRQLASGTLEGYEYKNSDTGNIYQLYWSNTAQTFNIPLPVNTTAVYDRYGGDVLTGATITVGFDPIIIEITP